MTSDIRMNGTDCDQGTVHINAWKVSRLLLMKSLTIQQRFKGTGMRWSEDGFNHLLHLRLAWVNGRFNPFFANDESLELKLYSPNR